MEVASLFKCRVANLPDLVWSSVLAANDQRLQQVGV